MARLIPNKVVFVCPPHFMTTWATTQIAPMFNTQGHLIIRTPAEDYSAVTEGEASSYYDYFSPNLAGVTLNTRRYGFTLQIKDQREEIYLALKELATLSTSTGYANYTTITCFDYHRVDCGTGNLWAAYQQGFTTRVGKIMVFDGVGGTVRTGRMNCNESTIPPTITEVPENSPYQRFGKGFSVKFLEYQRSEIY